MKLMVVKEGDSGIKCKYVKLEVFELLDQKRLLQIIKYNKKLQMLLNINIHHYKDNYKVLSSIEIELKPSDICGEFINLIRKDEEEKDREKYFHIYFNDSKTEIKNKYNLNENDKVKIIKILVEYKVTSLAHIFSRCPAIKSINFKKFLRSNIQDMSDMFYECTSLEEINLTNFITDNVVDMSYMFHGCSKLILLM